MFSNTIRAENDTNVYTKKNRDIFRLGGESYKLKIY